MNRNVQSDILVSVVIPTYKRKLEFRRALLSVLSQTYRNIEVIVIDDNVDDEFSQEVKNIISECNDNRVKYIKNEKNLGGALSRNQGIRNAEGKYVAFLDDDDCYVPQNIELKLEKFNNSSYDKLALVYGWVKSLDVDNKPLAEYKNTVSGCCLYEAMLECQAATSQWMCRKDTLCEVDMFSDVPSKQDSTLMLKLLLKGYEIDYVSEVLSYYYEHNNNRISMGNLKNLRGEQLLRELIRSNYDRLNREQIQEIERNISMRILRLAIRNGQSSLEKQELRTVMDNSPNKYKIMFIYLKWILKYKLFKIDRL